MVCKQTLCGHKGPVCSMVEMGTHVWSGSADQSILVWDAATYQLLYSLGDHGGYASIQKYGFVFSSLISAALLQSFLAVNESLQLRTWTS